MKFSLFSKSVWKKWLISYFIILLVPVIVGWGIYVSIEDIVQNEVNRTNSHLLLQIKSELDGVLADTERLNRELGYDFNVKDVLRMGEEIPDRSRYTILQLQKSLLNSQKASDNFEDIFLYFKSSDLVVSSSNALRSKEFYDTYFSDADMYDEWMEMLWGDNFETVYTDWKYVKNLEAIDVVASLKSYVNLTGKGSRVAVVSLLNRDGLLERFQNIINLNHGSVYILYENGNVLAGSDEGAAFEVMGYGELEEGKSHLRANIDGNDSVISYVQSDLAPIKYVCVYSYGEFWSKVENVRLITLYGLILVLIIAFPLTYVFVKRNYRPVNDILKYIVHESDNKMPGSEDEYIFIAREMSKAFNEKKEILSKMEMQSNLIKNNFFIKALKHGNLSQTDIDDAKKYLDTKFEEAYFLTVMLYADDFVNLFGGEDSMPPEEKHKYSLIIMENIFRELLSEYFACETVIFADCVVGVLNTDKKDISDLKSRLAAIIKKGENIIENHFGLLFKVGVSDIHIGMVNLYEAMSESEQVREYNKISEIEQICFYSDLDIGNPIDYYYPIDREYRLINRIKAGDYETASVILAEIYDINFNKNKLVNQFGKYLMYNILGTLMKVIFSDARSDEFLEDVGETEALINTNNIAGSIERVEKLLEKICLSFSEHIEDKNEVLTINITKYVEENFKNEDLNVNSIGEKFKMSASYISKIFKKESGISLMDYINMVRIQKAKEYMKEGGKTLAEVAKISGYGSVRTFGRIFSKTEGITPSEYKKLVKEGQ